MNKSIFEKIKEKINIVDVIGERLSISKKGKNFFALCPFHSDNHPSLSISEEKQIYKCFSCGAGGDVIKFLADFKKISYLESAKILAKKANLNWEFKEKKSLPKYNKFEEKIINLLKDANNFFKNALGTKEADTIKKYCADRKLSNKILEKFQIGFAPETGLKKFLLEKGHEMSTLINSGLVTQKGRLFFRNRLIFTISNSYGDVVAFSGRLVTPQKNEPKYLNSPESAIFKKREILYNFFNAKESIEREKQVYVVEGFLDAIALWKVGKVNTVATMGVNFSKEHINLIKNKEVILFYDNDSAGKVATFESIKILTQNNFKVFVVNVNKAISAKDPDQFLLRLGNKEFGKMVNDIVASAQWTFNFLIGNYKNPDPSKFESFVHKFAPCLHPQNNIEINFYSRKIAEVFKISPMLIEEELKKILNVRQEKNSSVVRKIVKNTCNHFFDQVILSMIKNPEFIDVFEEKRKENLKLFLNYPEELTISFIVKNKSKIIKEGVKILNTQNEFLKDLFNRIKYKGKNVKTKKHFLELLELLKEKTIRRHFKEIRSKIKSSKNDLEKAKLLIQLNKLKKDNYE